MSQYLYNSSGDLAEETLAAFETIGAYAAANALRKIKNDIFANAAIPCNGKERCDILSYWEEEDDDRAESFYKDIDSTMGWCNSVVSAIADYIKKHPSMFS